VSVTFPVFYDQCGLARMTSALQRARSVSLSHSLTKTKVLRRTLLCCARNSLKGKRYPARCPSIAFASKKDSCQRTRSSEQHLSINSGKQGGRQSNARVWFVDRYFPAAPFLSFQKFLSKARAVRLISSLLPRSLVINEEALFRICFREPA